MALTVEVVDSLAAIPAAEWDALSCGDPFLRHGFLAGLEDCACLEPQGWYPQHLVVRDEQQLAGAIPLYIRDNSYGEFVFDWSWADAYERAGGQYYPKLVSAIPFSPVTGARVLINPAVDDSEQLAAALIRAGIKVCNDNKLSSWHCLFPPQHELGEFEAAGMMTRLGCQYHWFNDSFEDFDAFLAGLTSKKRKQIKRERRLVNEQPITIETLTGDEIKPEHWSVFYRFYCSTFHRKWGEPRFNELFLQSLNERLPGVPVLILAQSEGEYVAGAFGLRGDDTFYGRHWGCAARFDNLHFELCYYQTIDYCIRHGLKRLDAGAQGEHKLARGFRPVKTYSTHWLADQGFRSAVGDFLSQETKAIEHYIEDCEKHTAFRQTES